jgi:hypothetical protein
MIITPPENGHHSVFFVPGGLDLAAPQAAAGGSTNASVQTFIARPTRHRARLRRGPWVRAVVDVQHRVAVRRVQVPFHGVPAILMYVERRPSRHRVVPTQRLIGEVPGRYG